MAFCSSPVFAIFDAQASLGYSGIDYKDNGSPASIGSLKDNNFKGMVFGLSGHLNFSIPMVLTIGVGPYLTSGPSMSFSGEVASSGATYTNTQFSIGGEVYGKLLVIPGINPYAKFGYGADTLKSTAALSGVSVETKFSGSGYRLLFGLEIPVAPMIGIFAEGGILGSTYDVTVVTISGLKAKATGYAVNFGVSLNL